MVKDFPSCCWAPCGRRASGRRWAAPSASRRAARASCRRRSRCSHSASAWPPCCWRCRTDRAAPWARGATRWGRGCPMRSPRWAWCCCWWAPRCCSTSSAWSRRGCWTCSRRGWWACRCRCGEAQDAVWRLLHW